MESLTQMVMVAVMLLVLSETMDARKEYYLAPGEGCKENFFLTKERKKKDSKLVEVCRECLKGWENKIPRRQHCSKIKKKKLVITTTTTTTTMTPNLTTTYLIMTTAQVFSTIPATTSTLTTEAPTATIPTTAAYVETTGKPSPQPAESSQKLPEARAPIGQIIMGVIIAILLVALITLVVIFFKYPRSKGSNRDDEESSVEYTSDDIHPDSAQPTVDSPLVDTAP